MAGHIELSLIRELPQLTIFWQYYLPFPMYPYAASIMILFPFSWIYFSSASHICLLQYVLEFVILSHFRVYDSICQCNYPYHLYRKKYA